MIRIKIADCELTIDESTGPTQEQIVMEKFLAFVRERHPPVVEERVCACGLPTDPYGCHAEPCLDSVARKAKRGDG